MGDYAGAMEASKRARLWSIVSVVVGIVLIAIMVIATAASNTSSAVG
jgi:cytochrome c-type biogenesis protein CcmE